MFSNPPIEALKARVYLKQGRLDKAQAWVRERNLSTEAEARYLDECELLTLARVRLAEGAFAGVSDLLEHLRALAETQKRTGSLIEIRLTQALAHQAQRQGPQALTALEHALTLAEPEGYLRIFVDEGEPLRLLVLDFRGMIENKGHYSGHPLLGYVKKLLAAFWPVPEAISQTQAANQNIGLTEPLNDREIEILRLIALGLSNAEIGQRLYLALSTVKGYNLRLFSKLQVQNRTEAVTRAREMGLL